MKIKFILLLVLAVSIHSQVLGIDLGTEFLKAALISPGKSFVIVQNTRSERKTPNTISFMGGIRLFEDQSLGKKIRYPNSTFSDLNILFPLLDDPTLNINYPHPFTVEQKDTNKTIYFQIDGNKVSLEQVYGMILKNIKTLASKQAGTEIKDCVLTIPGNWGIAARMAIINAASIGGLSILSVIRANTAAALNYAMTRNDIEPLNVMFINTGSYYLQTSIVKFWGYNDSATNKTIESVEVLSYSTITNMSGYLVDEKIATILADKFQAKYKRDPRSNKRSWQTLLAKSSDVKEILSANKETNVFIQGLIDGIDLQLPILRKQIQDSNSFDHLAPAIQNNLRQAKLKKQQIASVELIGGASRIPKLVSIITDYFNPIEVGTHINGDECMALGSVLHAANMSITFKVKKIHLYDGWPFALQTRITGGSGAKLLEENLFDKGSPNTQKKEVDIVFGDEETVTIDILKDGQKIQEFNIANIQKWKDTFNPENITKGPELKFTFTSSSVDIVGLKGFVAVYNNETKVRQITDYVKELLDDKKKQQQDQKADQENKQEKEQENKEDNKQEQQNAETSDKKKESIDEALQKMKKKFKKVSVKKNLTTIQQKLTKFNIDIDSSGSKYRRLTKVQVNNLQEVMKQYQHREKSMRQKAEIKNELQSKLYFLKNSFDDKFMKIYSTEDELENLKRVVEEKLEWLDENSYTGEFHDFKKQYNGLLRAANPIFNRSMEHQSRGKIINETFQYIQVAYDKTQDLNRTHSWLGQKIDGLLAKINQTAKGIIQKLEEMKDRPLNQDPIIYNHQLFRKAQKLRQQYYKLSIIPKPKKQKKAKVVETEEPKVEQPIDNEEKQTEEQQNEQDENNEKGQNTQL